MGEGESHPWWASRNDSRVAGYWTESPGRKRHLQWCPLASCSTLKEVDWQRTWRPPTPYRSMHQTLWFRDSLGREQGRSTKAQGHPCVYIYAPYREPRVTGVSQWTHDTHQPKNRLGSAHAPTAVHQSVCFVAIADQGLHIRLWWIGISSFSGRSKEQRPTLLRLEWIPRPKHLVASL